MWSKLKERLKNKPLEPHENVVCQNCETSFSGHFCPNCGQAVKDYDRPFSFIFYNFVGDFFAFDTRFFRTLLALVIRPGFLTKEYFEGRRVRYAPPLRIFIFVSFVLFLLLQNYTNRGLTNVLDSEITSLDSSSVQTFDALINQMNTQMDSSDVNQLDSVLAAKGVQVDSSGVDLSNFHVDMNTFRDSRDLRFRLTALANTLEKKLETETDPQKRMKLREYIGLCRSPENAMAKILQYISWAFFLLLPIFALILKLAYVRRNIRYMRHLVFSIHIHSFIFIVLTAVVALYLLFDSNLNTIISILLFAVPVYFVVAIKKFYGQSIMKVVVKFLSVSFLYNIVFITVIVLAVLNAIGLI